jgi:CRP-like cAMP-binding protein
VTDISAREKYTALRKVDLLARLSDAEIWELVRAGRWVRVPADTPVVREGESGRSLFFLGSGAAKVTKGGKLLGELGEGACFGEMAYIKAGEMPRSATVETLGEAVLAEFDAETLAETSLNCRLQLTTALLHAMVDRLAMANERLARGAN